MATLTELANHAATLRAIDSALGEDRAITVLSSTKWCTWQDEMLLRIARRMSGEFSNGSSTQLAIEVIDKYCPGLSVGIRTLHTAWWTTTTRTPRQPKLSDFPDALHAIYAPYVDIFRADSFMAPHIEKHAARYGTTVVAKLLNLPDVIDAALKNPRGYD
ncbi:MAG: hypothetical protein ABIP64_11495 [Burkholderiales bacterium]